MCVCVVILKNGKFCPQSRINTSFLRFPFFLKVSTCCF
nr:MAG TPA: hypothetical protein [Caudoviricetes sp.]